MRGIRIILRQQIVETMFGIVWKVLWELEAEVSKPRRPNRYQQRCDGLLSLTQICDSCFDQIGSR
jgi:hypothetical protein